MDRQLFVEFKVSFNLRQPKGAKPTLIYAVISFSGKQYKVSIGVKIYPTHWDKHKQIALLSNGLTKLDNFNNSIVNTKIREVLLNIEQFKMYLCENTDAFNNVYPVLKQFVNPTIKIKRVVKSMENATIILERIVLSKEKNKPNSRDVNASRIRDFRLFLKNENIDDVWGNMNLQTVNKYRHYLIEMEQAPQTINGKLTAVISALKAVSKVDNISFDYVGSNVDKVEPIPNKLSKTQKKSKQKSLTEEQLKQLYELPLTGKEEEARDIFICQALVGQRIGDMPVLFNKGYTVNNDGTISFIQQKTGEEANLPLFPIAKCILDKYKNGFTYIKNFNLNDDKRADDGLNKIIRKVCQKAGFDSEESYSEQRGLKVINRKKKLFELIHTHIARHTFITIMCRHGVSKELVIIATGHTDTKMIDEVYSHLTKEDNRMQLTREMGKFTGEMFNMGEQAKEVASVSGIKKTIVNNFPRSVKALDYLFAETILLRLHDLHDKDINIFDLVETMQAIRVVKDISTIDKVKGFLSDVDKSQLYERVDEINKMVWLLARHYLDITMVQVFQQKVIELELSNKIREIIDTDSLDYYWSMEEYENENYEKNP